MGGLALKTLVLWAFQKDAGMEILEKCWSVVRRKDLWLLKVQLGFAAVKCV